MLCPLAHRSPPAVWPSAQQATDWYQFAAQGWGTPASQDCSTKRLWRNPPSQCLRQETEPGAGVWCLVAWASALSPLQHTLSCRPCCTVPLSLQMCSHSAQCKAEPVTCLSSPTWAFLAAQLVKNPPAMQETPIRFLGQEGPLEKG